jgi:hypothetical protein
MKIKSNTKFESKLEKKIKKHKNIIRDFSNISKDFIKYITGCYYGCLHTILIFLGALLILFSNNIYSLCALLLIISLDALAIVVRHDCPLTQMEEKYLGISGKRQINEFLKKCGVVYNCSHLYESQMELMINVWALTACKIVVLLFLKMIKIELKYELLIL